MVTFLDLEGLSAAAGMTKGPYIIFSEYNATCKRSGNASKQQWMVRVYETGVVGDGGHASGDALRDTTRDHCY